MDNNVIKMWAQSQLAEFDVEESKQDVDFLKLDDLPDTYECKNILKQLIAPTDLYKLMELKEYNCFVLEGASGNGKHTVANAITRTYIDDLEAESYYGVWIDKNSMSGIDSADVKAALSAVYEVMTETVEENSTKGIIVFDLLENKDYFDDVAWAIAESNEDISNICTVVISCNENDSIDMLTKDVACLVRFQNPTLSQRKSFFESGLVFQNEDKYFTINIKSAGYTEEELAKKTDGFSYMELEQLCMLLKVTAAGKKADTEKMSITLHMTKEDVETAVAMTKKAVSGGVSFAQPIAYTALEVKKEETKKSDVLNDEINALLNKKDRSYDDNKKIVNQADSIVQGIMN